jgi:hypothetical protein
LQLAKRSKDKETYTNGQKVYEKVFNITKHQRNANQNTNEISLYPSSNAINELTKNNKCCSGGRERGTFAHRW